MRYLMGAAPALAEVRGYCPNASDATITTSAAATPAQVASWLGGPDDAFTGIGGQWVQYDLGDYRVVNGSGQDFNVYEVDFGSAEWHLVDILVSANGADFFNVEGTFGAAVDLVGDNAHGNADFRRSFDVGGAVAGLGASSFRYIRIAGTRAGALGGGNNFDLDAIGLVNWEKAVIVTPPGGGSNGGGGAGEIPELATWTMMIDGFGLVGAAARRRRPAVLA